MTFNDNDEIKGFVRELKQELLSIGEGTLSNELKNWEDTFFTSSSEFLGELKIVLEQIKIQNFPPLKGKTRKQIDGCIRVINSALGI